MTCQNCQNCILLQAEIKRLEAENKRLTMQLRRAVKVIKMQRRQLNAIFALVHSWIVQAQRAMANHLPRASYALWRGRLEVAGEVYSIACQDWASSILESL